MDDKDVVAALFVAKEFVEFCKVPEVKAVIDGAFDPDYALSLAEELLDKYHPKWRENEAALSA